MKPLSIVLNVLFLVVFLSLAFWYLFLGGSDPELSEAKPYLDKIILEDINLRSKAIAITQNCSSGSKECYINEVYRHVVKNYDYYADPRNDEFIQSPFETIQLGGGDCEDLTILLSSLLENIGIETYLVLTEDHAYSLACNVNIEDLQEEIVSSSNIEQNLYDETISLDSNYAKYYGGNGEETDVPFEIKYEIDSDKAIDVLAVPSSESLDDWSKGKSYDYYPSCSRESVYRISESCSINQYGGVLMVNEGNEDAVVSIKVDAIYLALDPETFSTKYYEMDDKKCVVLDATVGEYGYPGYDTDLEGEKKAIDPVTRNYFYLE